ncbi:MAG TPA: porin [bacterium]|nr:porin [bacterium]
MTKRAAIWLLVMAIALAASCVFGDILTVKHAHGELTLKGLIQTYYGMYEDDALVDGFDMNRVRLGVEGNVYDKVFFNLEFDVNTSGNGLKDAYITFKHIPHVDLSFGQMYKPATYESLTSSRKLPFILYAVPTQYMRSNNVSNRDIGAKVTFHLEKDDYTFITLEGGVFNGAGANTSDNNDQKDWVLRACLQPVKGVEVFGNYTYGTYGAKGLSILGVSSGHEPYQEYSAGLAIDYQGLDFVGEWIGMNTRYLPAGVGMVDPHERSWDMYGFYTHLGFKIDTGYDYFSEVEPIARYEYLDPNSNNHVINDLARLITCGLNVAIDKHYAKLQLNYIINLNDSGPGRELADNVFLAQLQAAF